MTKITDAEKALSGIKDGSVVAISGFNAATMPEYLIAKLYDLYRNTGHPNNLFIISDTLPAANNRGLDLVAKGMYADGDFNFIRGFMLPFLGQSPWLQRLALENKVAAYTWPIGVSVHWFRSKALGLPAITKVGLGTFLDPRQDGVYLNELARERRECSVRLTEINGEDYLVYDCPKPSVALIRGSVADELGNLSMEDEAIYGTVLAITQATKAMPNPGTVIAQVMYVTKAGAIRPKSVHVPGPLIDYVVEAPLEYHVQSASIKYDPRVCGRVTPSNVCIQQDGKLDLEKVIARRVTVELVNLMGRLGRPLIVNLGIGIPSTAARIISEEGLSDLIFTTVESGPWGGVALNGDDFGVAIAPFAVLPMPDQFTIYEGGAIHATSLGFMQVGPSGDVNPSFLPERLPGPGGFPSIVHGAPRIYFAGAFTAGKRDIRVENGRLIIGRDGDITKFVKKPYKIAFNAELALKAGKEVLYITERAVFRLTPSGLLLEEYAPGVDIERDILGRMEFKPQISRGLRQMEPELFREQRMGLREVALKLIKQ